MYIITVIYHLTSPFPMFLLRTRRCPKSIPILIHDQLGEQPTKKRRRLGERQFHFPIIDHISKFSL